MLPATESAEAEYIVCIESIIRKQGFIDIKKNGLLNKAGKYSLELYIVHVAIRNIMGTVGIGTVNLLIYAVCILISVPIAISFSYLYNKSGALYGKH